MPTELLIRAVHQGDMRITATAGSHSVAKALAMPEQTLCPVWAVLKAGTPITASFRVVDG